MQDRKVMAKEFEELGRAIERLRKAEKELDELKPPRDVFGPQIESIRSKLKRVDKVEEVEQELTVLRRQMEERKTQRERVAEPVKGLEETGDFPTRSSEFSLPSELERLYDDDGFIGSGGFARVFQAKRRSDGTQVAVKVPLHLDASTGRSFVREITSWQRLKHMNIVRLYDLNILPIPYLEIELCQRSLNELPKPLDVERAASLVFHVAEGLKNAHSEGIIHRDLKPQNILLQGEVPKISDWGLSKVVAESKSSEVHSLSPLYAAPEQLAPQKFGKPDHRTDIYQLGSIFYELATGELPFKGDNVTELMAQIINVEPAKTSVLNPATSAIEPIIMKCLQKEVKERYQSVAEMQRDLAEFLKVEFEDSLGKSRGDMKRSGYYCAELCLVHLRVGDLGEALKYAADLRHYASEEAKADLAAIISELEFRSKEDMEISEELLERAAVVLHQVRMGR